MFYFKKKKGNFFKSYIASQDIQSHVVYIKWENWILKFILETTLQMHIVIQYRCENTSGFDIKYRSLWRCLFIVITNSGSPFTVTQSQTKKKWKYSVIQLKHK